MTDPKHGEVDQIAADEQKILAEELKKIEEEQAREVERRKEEAKKKFLLPYSKDRQGKITKIKEVIFNASSPEVKTNLSTETSSVTLEQVGQLLVTGQKQILATVQNIIDKSLGK